MLMYSIICIVDKEWICHDDDSNDCDDYGDGNGDENDNYNLNDYCNHSFQLIWNWFLKWWR